jgi:phosphoglycerol transferase MdoB-like AlkP superfamily enzyme
VRFWLKPEERRPDPEPVAVDDRRAFTAGLVIWLIALALAIVLLPQLTAAGNAWWLWSAVAGVALGAIGIGYTQFKRRRR